MSSAKARLELVVDHGVAAVLDHDEAPRKRSSQGSASTRVCGLGRAAAREVCVAPVVEGSVMC